MFKFTSSFPLRARAKSSHHVTYDHQLPELIIKLPVTGTDDLFRGSSQYRNYLLCGQIVEKVLRKNSLCLCMGENDVAKGGWVGFNLFCLPWLLPEFNPADCIVTKKIGRNIHLGTRYSWEKTNNFNPKITAKQLVINILRTFRPSTGAIFNAINVPQTGTSNNVPHVEKELKEFIDQHLPDTMLRFVHVTKNLKQQLHFKDPQPQLLRSNVVYRLNCSCGSFYIGQTRRNLVKRLDEHQTSLNSEVCNHLQSNPNHRVDFNNPQILTSSPDKSKLLILESLCIQQLKPSLNLDSKSFPLRLFNT